MPIRESDLVIPAPMRATYERFHFAPAVRAGDFLLCSGQLGIGPDGHCASLFPGHPALEARDAIAVAVHDSPKPPPDRVTLTFEAMERCRAVWFIASGEGKAEAVARALAEDGTVQETPARGVTGDETVWWLDADAASQL